MVKLVNRVGDYFGACFQPSIIMGQGIRTVMFFLHTAFIGELYICFSGRKKKQGSYLNLDREQRFKEDIEICAFRFLQEGLTNVVKHSGASHADVSISLKEGKLELIVSDTGNGFDMDKIYDWSLTGTHFGIVGMQERIKGLNGEFEIEAKAGQGVKLKASISISMLTERWL